MTLSTSSLAHVNNMKQYRSQIHNVTSSFRSKLDEPTGPAQPATCGNACGQKPLKVMAACMLTRLDMSPFVSEIFLIYRRTTRRRICRFAVGRLRMCVPAGGFCNTGLRLNKIGLSFFRINVDVER